MKVIIIGGGNVGAYIAKILLENNCSVKVIENREVILDKLKDEIPQDDIIPGNGTDPDLLEASGIAETDVVAAVTGADETNLVASTIAKFEFGVPRVIARVNNPRNAWLFNSGMGVDAGLNMADLMAHIVVDEIELKNIFTMMKINRGSHSILRIEVDEQSKAVNKAVKDLEIPKKAVLIAVSRNGEVMIPRGDTVIYGGDKILIFADEKAKVKINELFGA